MIGVISGTTQAARALRKSWLDERGERNDDNRRRSRSVNRKKTRRKARGTKSQVTFDSKIRGIQEAPSQLFRLVH
jgi:hypothetical protein